MKTLIRVIAAAAICLAMQSSFAVTVFGRRDCGEWLAEKSNVQKSWLMGYLSGMNYTLFMTKKVDPLNELSSGEQAYVWMDNYCKKNPLNRLDDGALDLIIELIERLPNTKARK